MADTPPPDIPDPASPTPVPRNPPATTGLPGSARLLRPKAPRLPGTYAENYGGDMDWRKGITGLWVIFILAAVAELIRGAFSQIALGGVDPVPWVEMARVGAEAALFLTLWLGWGWLRWLLAVMDFLWGAWFIIRYLNPVPLAKLTEHPLPPHHSLVDAPQLALGLIYLFSALYLAFSANVIGFTQHRREEGRGWVVLPVMLVLGAFVGLYFSEPFLYQQWLGHLKTQGTHFADESLRAMSEHWDASVYAARANPDFLKKWSESDRKATFNSLSVLGPFQAPGQANSVISTGLDETGDGFLIKMGYDSGRAVFAHGQLQMGMAVTRRVFGSWRLEGMMTGDMHVDAPPPAPAAPPAAPPPVPSPALGSPTPAPMVSTPSPTVVR